MSRHRKAEPVASGRHRLAPGVPAGRIPREYRHVGGGHREAVGCFGSLLLGVVMLLVTLIVDTHRTWV